MGLYYMLCYIYYKWLNMTCYMVLLTRFLHLFHTFHTFYDTNTSHNSELERMKAELEKTTEVATNLAIHKIEHDFEERKHKVRVQR